MVPLDMNTVRAHAVSIQSESFNSAPRLPFLLLLTHLLHSYSPLYSPAVTLAFPALPSPSSGYVCVYPTR
jgi:hypothetical protein